MGGGWNLAPSVVGTVNMEQDMQHQDIPGTATTGEAVRASDSRDVRESGATPPRVRLSVRGLPSEEVARLRAGAPDAHGLPALVKRAEGRANPCRHCLQLIAPGDEMLVLAYRPFGTPQPYAEVGPIFLHRHRCERYEGGELPDWFRFLDLALVRGYADNDWIRYETGAVVPGVELRAASERILADRSVAYVHIRSKFNCFQCRVDRLETTLSGGEDQPTVDK